MAIAWWRYYEQLIFSLVPCRSHCWSHASRMISLTLKHEISAAILQILCHEQSKKTLKSDKLAMAFCSASCHKYAIIIMCNVCDVDRHYRFSIQSIKKGQEIVFYWEEKQFNLDNFATDHHSIFLHSHQRNSAAQNFKFEVAFLSWKTKIKITKN